MTLFFGDRIKQATATTGTGSITLGSAETGYQTFSAAGMADTEETRYLIEDGDAWEIGKGTLSSSGTVLSRTLTSSSTGSLLNLSGSALVMCTPSSEDIVMWQAQWPEASTAVAIGEDAGRDGTPTGSTFVGKRAGLAGPSGSFNTFLGYSAGSSFTGPYNYSTLIGGFANSTSTGNNFQTCVGYDSKCGNGSVSVGYNAGRTANNYHVSIGYSAASATNSGNSSKVSVGALSGSNTGDYTVSIGYGAHRYSSGNRSVAIGYNTLAAYTGSTTDGNNVVIGYQALQFPSNCYENVAIGRQAGWYGNFSGSNTSNIGAFSYPSSASASNEFTLGNSSTTSLRCNDTSISTLSDERDKTDIQDLNYGLDFINDVRPVKFTWNRRDGSMGARRDIGFIAQELYDVEIDHSSTSDTRLAMWLNPEKMEARPQAMFPILVKAVQELSQKCDALEARIAELEGA
jgi:hypothetical protein